MVKIWKIYTCKEENKNHQSFHDRENHYNILHMICHNFSISILINYNHINIL